MMPFTIKRVAKHSAVAIVQSMLLVLGVSKLHGRQSEDDDQVNIVQDRPGPNRNKIR